MLIFLLIAGCCSVCEKSALFRGGWLFLFSKPLQAPGCEQQPGKAVWSTIHCSPRHSRPLKMKMMKILRILKILKMEILKMKTMEMMNNVWSTIHSSPWHWRPLVMEHQDNNDGSHILVFWLSPPCFGSLAPARDPFIRISGRGQWHESNCLGIVGQKPNIILCTLKGAQ